MNQRYSGRVVLVTGAARGIGLATAEAFAREEATVIGADLSAGPESPFAAFFQLNAADDHAVESMMRSVGDRFGKLDVLVCNAGKPWQSTSLTATEDDWRECLDANLKSVWTCARRAHPLLLASGAGSIVTVASAQGLRSNRRSFPYSAAKGGVLALTRTLAVEYAPNIRANAVIPGQIESVRTESYFASFSDPDEARRRVLSTFPMRRLGRPEDIARAILFLSSNDAEWITGTFLTVDGGRDAALVDLSDLEAPR